MCCVVVSGAAALPAPQQEVLLSPASLVQSTSSLAQSVPAAFTSLSNTAAQVQLYFHPEQKVIG